MNKDLEKSINITIDEFDSRMASLRKYVPFFEFSKLNSSSQLYKKYDMSTLCIGFISLMFYEGKLKSRNLNFTQIKEFVKEFIEVSYDEELNNEKVHDLTSYIIDKFTNNGNGYEFNYYSPKKQEMFFRKNEENVSSQNIVSFIEVTKSETSNEFHYALTTEGIDFFLQTKEWKESNKITIHLLLLKKFLETNSYEDALFSLNNVSAEVIKQINRVGDIENFLQYGGKAGYEEYLKYIESSTKKIADERDLFQDTVKSINDLREEYLNKVEKEELGEKEKNALYCLEKMDIELKRVVDLHHRLLAKVVTLAMKSTEIQQNKMENLLKTNFNFNQYLDSIVDSDNALAIQAVVTPLLKLKKLKSFSIEKMDNIILSKKKDDIEQDSLDKETSNEEKKSFENELRGRVIENYSFLLKVIIENLKDKEYIDTRMLKEILEDKYNINILLNPDFVSFVIDLKGLNTAKTKKSRKKDDDDESGKWSIEKAYEKLKLEYDKELPSKLKCRAEFISDDFVEIKDGFGLTNTKFYLIEGED